MQVLIAISGFCGFCSRIGNAPCTTPFDFLFVISIHVLAWGTTTNEAARLSVVHISIHVPARGTTSETTVDYGQNVFQSTFPRGERHKPRRQIPVTDYFNPRSREGNDFVLQRLHGYKLHFNPRSREGNDTGVLSLTGTLLISIHVPARGTTRGRLRPVLFVIYFNPRSREGNDVAFAFFRHFSVISIHVPARGTTMIPSVLTRGANDFNPRSREGNDILLRTHMKQ